ncbi:ABC transporter substrate-binding protein [Pseudooceanicola sp. CBS1P-1]|uniref:ABC transporter substrate-binding protein n=1 Tax=Pseudooceanicola albus TaxID=2692189 RepID=A0A6L7G6M2_9RHOB|nr:MULTISPECIES: ABC transporter substrate-binding protein [Pseudooceanicola]MBT9382989.1 ABC transporter substrate-binding protein [Pseudooceanicola endophyticus]MXN19177.1 ABC transporter substrate-binding protein [Pseudooceanicola albus]
MFRTHLASAAALLAMAAPLAAQDLTKVTFGTNWVAEAEHGGFYQAVVDGTYKDCGLDVTILPGGPQVNNQALLLAGKIDFYMGSTLGAFFGVEQDLPLVDVAALFQKDPQVLLTHPGKAKTFEDLKPMKMIVADATPYYSWLKAAYGFTDEQRQTYTFNSAPFIVDENAAQQGYVSSEPFSIKQQTGWAPDVWLLADHGYTAYATTIQTMQGTIDKSPEVVQCFVDGSIKGWYNYLYGDRSKTDAMIKEVNPDMSQEAIDYAVQAMKDQGIVDSGDALTLGIGAITDAREKDFYDKMVEGGVVKAGLDISKAYTKQFVDKGVGMDLKK